MLWHMKQIVLNILIKLVWIQSKYALTQTYMYLIIFAAEQNSWTIKQTSGEFFFKRAGYHTAPESVKRVKGSAQILVKSFFWRLNATNTLGGSSGHQRTPLLNACQKWSPLMTGATSKCICGAQPLEKWLIHYFCVQLFTCLTRTTTLRLWMKQ